jgi:hypothetical protein
MIAARNDSQTRDDRQKSIAKLMIEAVRTGKRGVFM